eukprot:c14005_g1_i1 orf=331-4776(-)
MMGKGAEGGCTRNGCNGGANIGLLPFYKGPSQSGSTSRMRGSAAGQGLDVFSQVLKSLAIKPAIGELGTAAPNGSLSVPISSENRRKQRVKRNDINGSLLRDSFENSWYKDSNGSPFWLEMEEYFREPTPQDIQLLLPKTKLDTWTLCNALDSLLQMPVSGFADKETRSKESGEDAVPLSALKQNSLPLSIHCQADQRLLGDPEEHVDALKMCEQQQPTKRKIVATGSASKRRKLTPSAFEVVTAVISPPPENGDEELCHVCYGGDSDEQNQILFCDSCDVAVHQECYGIKVVPEDQWLCSMCNYRGGADGEALLTDFRDCVLCPVNGGALKPIASLKEQSSKDQPKAAFGHLFCCQWIPETYIGDMEVMEPVMNVEGVREERWKLLCSICKDKHGACIQCSHGLCATAFHPLCARQAKFRMEVSSKANGDELDFRAFCSKHTVQNGKPPANMRAEIESEHGAQDASNNGGNVTESSLNKVCKKLKVATSRRENSTRAGADGTVINSVGFIKNNLFLRRGVIMNGGLPSNVVKGLSGPADSVNTVDANAIDVDAIYPKKDLSEQSIATSQDNSNQTGMPHDRHPPLRQGKDSSDRGVHENAQSWILGSSYASDAHNQLPPLAGRNSTKASLTDEAKENTNFNRKDSLCRTYRNKRRKLEQQALVQPKEEVLLSINQGVGNTGLVESREMPCVGFGSENMQDATSTPRDQCTEVCANFDEERRQRGLSGDASTSQDIPSTSQTVQLPGWMGQKGQEVEPVFVLEGKSTLRPGHGTNMHPFLLTRLLEVQSSIAERGFGIETGKMLEAFRLTDSFLASASSCIDVPHIKVPRSKRYQCQGFVQKRNLASKSAKIASSESFEAQLKQLEHAKKIGILDMAPGNEVEGEIVAMQLNLIAQAQKNRDQCERLVLKIIPTLSNELRAHWRKSKDLAFVNHYLSMLREAKKQGRKERRSKEAQAVLAAATAVAAASSRLGGLRKDAPGSLANDEKPYLSRDSFCPPVITASHFGGVSSRPSIPKPTNYGWTSSSQTSSCGKASSIEQDIKPFDSRNYGSELNSGESREQFITCDICKDSSSTNSTTICHRCKVVVHLQCYGVDGFLKNDWQCQPCTEITRHFQGLKASDVTDRATPGHDVVCLLCFGRSGAFKKSAESKWVHVFCAQWIPDRIPDKDDGAQHESLKLLNVEKILQECSVCHTKQGARLRCSFGHCHGSFHPLCARDSGLYMNVKRSPGGRIQHRAYCEKHSFQQRQKAASRKYGSADELSVLLQMRAELERVRILCERVCKRERIKRDRFLCTLDIYTAHLSSLSSSAMASNDLSSTSNTLDTTTAFRKMSSLHTQQNDSVTAKPHHGPESESYSWNSVAGEGNKYQDSLSGDSVYQTQISCSEPSRETPARSQLSDAAAAHGQGRLSILAGAMAKSCDQKRLGKHQKAETLHTEVVMTPTEASVQNQRLPKGYAYVPVGTLPKGKMNLSEASALKDL